MNSNLYSVQDEESKQQVVDKITPQTPAFVNTTSNIQIANGPLELNNTQKQYSIVQEDDDTPIEPLKKRMLS